MSSPTQSTFPTSSEVHRALLLATLSNLSTPHFLAPIISSAAATTRQRLVIILFSRLFNTHPSTAYNVGFASGQGISHTDRWDEVQRLLTFVYVQATKVAQDMGKVLMEVDVLLKGMDEDVQEDLGLRMDVTFRVQGDSIAVPLPASISSLRQSYLAPGDHTPELAPSPPPPKSPSSSESTPSLFPVVALGGTFDHLHAGHKILLSMAAWITNQKIIVGVTHDALLKNKSNKHLLEGLSTRISRVRAFLGLFKPGLVYDVVPIDDVYGPTGWDPNIQALVVSKETLSGAEAIASHRATHALPPLQTFIIDVISPSSSSLDHEDIEMLKQTKMSSTFIREWIVMNSRQEEEEDEDEVESKNV